MQSGAGAGTPQSTAGVPPVSRGSQPAGERFPALGLRIASPVGAAPVVDFQRDFGATGDGEADDLPAFERLAEAVNAGRIAAGTVVSAPPGVYRVVGNRTVTFRRPVVLRGAGTGESIVRLEYTAQRSVFLRAQGSGMYESHSASLFNGRAGGNRYPNAPFSPVQGVPRRGDQTITVDRPELFKAGDHVYLLCDDYGDEVVYSANNKRFRHFLVKQYLQITRVEGRQVTIDTALRHDFAGASPRLYRWQPLIGFGIEHLAIEDHSQIEDTEATNTFKAVSFDGVVDGWVWDVHFLDNTSIPLSVGNSRRVVVSECLFDRARHIGGGGNGYLPELYYTDDCLVEYCTSIAGRHALICNWSCWGNVFRYNRLEGTPNTETHGEYCVENLYLRNDARSARMEIGGGGDRVHAHDGPHNELRENYGRIFRILKRADRANRLIGNWHVEPHVLQGVETELDGNQRVPAGWEGYPYAPLCGHDHAQTAETARPANTS